MISNRRGFLAMLAGGPTVGSAMPAESEWIPLIDGRNLRGWKAEGKADWSVQGDTIVGHQGPGGAAGDLFTERRWADFELEAEWKMRFPGNSGIWFRWAGAKTGYQADILDEAGYPGVLSGSLYCMGKAFIAENRDPSSVNKSDWNRIRITAAGDHIVVEQNGSKVADVRDSTFPGAGSVGIQVHQGEAFEGMEVRVRGLKLRPL